MKTIYYYQTFVGLHKLLTHLTDIDVINVSSIHFNESKDGSKNIYLNKLVLNNLTFLVNDLIFFSS